MENPRSVYKILSEIEKGGSEDGCIVGRDPRKVSKEEYESAGHIQKPIMDVIRAKCLDCCCGQPNEVRRCMAVNCDLWPYRMGTNPLRDKVELTEEQRMEKSERMKIIRQRQK